MEIACSGRARRRSGSVACTMAAAALAGVLLVSCTQAPAGTEPSAPASIPAAVPTAEPLREAREGWKVFTDPARLVSFELPRDWVVQPLQPEPGAYAPDSLHYAVRTPEGTTTAELHSGILTAEAPCPEAERTPYYVIGSEPLELTGEPPATSDSAVAMGAWIPRVERVVDAAPPPNPTSTPAAPVRMRWRAAV